MDTPPPRTADPTGGPSTPRPTPPRPSTPRPSTPRPAAGTDVLRAVGLSCGHGTRTVVADVDLAVRAGELTALVGPNGAGKSTLVHTLAGDLEPLAGSVELQGDPLPSLRPLEAARRRAVLPQDGTVAFPFTVDQVVRMGRSPWLRTDAVALDDALVEWAMAACAVTEMADRPVPHLSGGERARVMLARTLVQDTPVVLLDEPVAALDPHHAEEVLALLAARARAGDAVVVVLHDLTAAATHADRVVLLADGGVAVDGPPAAVMTTDILSQAYGAPLEVITHPRTGTPIVLPVSR